MFERLLDIREALFFLFAVTEFSFYRLIIKSQTNMSNDKTIDGEILNSFIYWKTLPNDSVLRAFKTYFPEASNIKWRMLKHDKYKAKFTYQNETLNVIFTNKGKLVKVYSE